MKRIEIISLLTDGKSIIERLQRRGVVDLLQYEIPDDQNGIEKIDTSPSIQLFERNSAAVRQALAILNEYSPEKQSIMASFEPPPPHRVRRRRRRNDIRSKQASRSVRKCGKASKRGYGGESLEAGALDCHRFIGTSQTAAFIGTLTGQWDRSANRI